MNSTLGFKITCNELNIALFATIGVSICDFHLIFHTNISEDMKRERPAKEFPSQ